MVLNKDLLLVATLALPFETGDVFLQFYFICIVGFRPKDVVRLMNIIILEKLHNRLCLQIFVTTLYPVLLLFLLYYVLELMYYNHWNIRKYVRHKISGRCLCLDRQLSNSTELLICTTFPPQLLDSCLKSSLLPAYLAAAFCKKLSRLALFVPPAGALVIIALVNNLLQRHTSINCLVHHVRT